MLAIIQARCSSKRFKNKVLVKIYGKPLIHHVISRVKKSKKISKIIVSTSKNKSDDNLVKYLKKIKVKFHRGELNNVAKRLLNASEKNKQNFFLRVNGDSPLIDPKIIDKAISIHKKFKSYNLITNVFPRTFPKGQSVEIISNNILRENLNRMSRFEKEHVTLYFYRNSQKFLIKNFIFKKKLKLIKTAIDNKKDLMNILKKIEKKKFRLYKIL